MRTTVIIISAANSHRVALYSRLSFCHKMSWKVNNGDPTVRFYSFNTPIPCFEEYISFSIIEDEEMQQIWTFCSFQHKYTEQDVEIDNMSFHKLLSADESFTYRLWRRNIVHNLTCQQRFLEAAMLAWTGRTCHSTSANSAWMPTHFLKSLCFGDVLHPTVTKSILWNCGLILRFAH